jgi:hypothetical protein
VQVPTLAASTDIGSIVETLTSVLEPAADVRAHAMMLTGGQWMENGQASPRIS